MRLYPLSAISVRKLNGEEDNCDGFERAIIECH